MIPTYEPVLDLRVALQCAQCDADLLAVVKCGRDDYGDSIQILVIAPCSNCLGNAANAKSATRGQE